MNEVDKSSIYDIFILPFNSGRLFVVADSLETVQNACEREQGPAHKLSYTYRNYRFVPDIEAQRVMLIRNGIKSLRRRKMRGTWVKVVKHDRYRGDFGVVLDIDGEDGGEVQRSQLEENLELLVVPRVIFSIRDQGPTMRKYEDVQAVSVPLEKRPRQKFLTYDDAVLRFGTSAIKLHAFDIFSVAGQRFYAGMHVITVNRKDIDENSKPTALDIQTFMQTGTTDMDIINRAFLRVHDKVKVIRGEYLSNVGRVLSRESDSVIIVAFGDNGKGREVNLAFEQLERVFGINDWVRVMLGEHRNAVGVVTSVSDEELTIACNCKDDPADILNVRDPRFRMRPEEDRKEAAMVASDVPKPRALAVRVFHVYKDFLTNVKRRSSPYPNHTWKRSTSQSRSTDHSRNMTNLTNSQSTSQYTL